MKRHFFTYATKEYLGPASRLSYSAVTVGGFDSAHIFGPHDITCSFRQRNRELLAAKRGSGLYLWKPFTIQGYLNRETVSTGDLVCYCDALYLFVDDIRSFLDAQFQNDSKVLLFRNKPNEGVYPERQYTRARVLRELGATPEMLNSPQVWAGFFACKKDEYSVRLVDRWLEECQRPDMLSDPRNDEVQDSFFVAHRHDQSILSILAKKSSIPFREFPKGPLQNMRRPFQMTWRLIPGLFD